MTDTMTDTELLRAWSGRRCQPSFQALVKKYLGLVQGVALRRTGDAALAGDIAQSVFAKLAAKAGRILAEPTLAPWLHHCAWCESMTALRRESTRTRHMKDYADHLRAAGESAASISLQDALPHLDAAIQALPGDDQRIVLMRFFEGRGLRDIASALGKTEAAVRKQGQRALEKIALRLRRQGVTVSAAAIAAGLGVVLSPPAHAAAVAAIATGAVTGGAKLTLFDQVLTLMNTKTKTALITAACMSLPLLWQWQRASGMEDRLAQAQRDARALKARAMMREPDTVRTVRSFPPALPGTVSAASGSPADWETALKNPDPLQRMSALAALMGTLTPASAPEIAQLFTRLRQENGGNRLYETEHRNFLRAWGRLDGKAALVSLQSPAGQPNDSSETLAALAGWAQSDPGAARGWLEALVPGDTATALALGLIDGWALQDFDAAAAYATSLPRSTARDQFRSLLLQRALTAGGAAEAERWLTNIPDDEHNVLYKQRAFDELVAALMTRDPSGAAAWVTQMGRQSYMSGDGIPELASRLANSSPAEALRWLENLGPGTGEAAGKTNDGYGSVLTIWAEKDPAAAGAWLQSQNSHPAYDQMAAAYAGGLAATDGAAALAWADSIRDESQRQAARDNAARTILQSGDESARATLLSAGFTPETIDGISQNRRLVAFYDAQISLTAEKMLEDTRDAAAKNVAFLNVSGDAGADDAASGVAPEGANYSRAHPAGAPANCAQCHR